MKRFIKATLTLAKSPLHPTLIIQTLFFLTIAFLCLAHLSDIYDVPLNKTYYTGAWDEPFSINSGINALKKGDPRFYMYGGSSVYPYTFFFKLSEWSTGTTAYYKSFDQKLDGYAWPYSHKIFPVRPIYEAKIAQIIFATILSFIFVLLGTLWLFPFAALFLHALDQSTTLAAYRLQLLPESHLILFSGITCLFFVKTLLSDSQKKYNKLMLWTALFASLTVSTKLSAAFICLLPLSLLWHLVKESETLTETKKILLKFTSAMVLPFIFVNPALILNGRSYLNTVKDIAQQSRPTNGQWLTHTQEIATFFKELYFFQSWNLVLVLILILAAAFLIAKRNPPAFFGFFFFYIFTFLRIADTSFKLYSRHFSILILPSAVLVLIPLAIFFNNLSRLLKKAIYILGLLITIVMLPVRSTFAHWSRLATGSFTQTWPQESRDEFRKFVLQNNTHIYFFDFHEFSLPNDIDNRLTPITSVDEIPTHLADNEYVAYIRYDNCPEVKYLNFTKVASVRFQKVRAFGDNSAPTNFATGGPKINPLIVLLR